MALTRDYRETVLARIKRDPQFARALYAQAINAMLEGETAEGLSMLRDLVHAEITFRELARQTGFWGEGASSNVEPSGKSNRNGDAFVWPHAAPSCSRLLLQFEVDPT